MHPNLNCYGLNLTQSNSFDNFQACHPELCYSPSSLARMLILWL